MAKPPSSNRSFASDRQRPFSSVETTPHPGPTIGITVGDFAGVGPELALRVLADHDPATGAHQDSDLDRDPKHLGDHRIKLYGPAAALLDLAKRLGIDPPRQDAIRHVGDLDLRGIRPGHPDRQTGKASFDAVNAAIDDALRGDLDAVVTGPIQKEAWHSAGVPFPGHTELFAERTGTEDYAMMLCGDEVACVLVTIHIAIADVPRALSVDGVLRSIRLAHRAVTDRPVSTIAVLALNPHAGGGGQMGHGEEERCIHPAIEAARAEGIDVVGPLPPDTAFTPEMRKRVGVYVCMYHDQGLIPMKALCFDRGINVTLGLPIIRTSVDHGTALDLAWKGVASDASLRAAVQAADQMARRKAATASAS